ncbi:MAG: 50S ribosomal protein L15 [Rhodothermales bacterium]|nr:50S ribosomal protein L15 [Rhodothermales bacterium]MBO6781404.1 50S ribosomal protein L15 [Rhodothermales bacterium]
MDLSNLKPAEGSTKSKKRIARGVGSGYGGHSSTKGNKGQKARAGASIPAWFEGGQMPLQRRVPKGGFKNRFRVEYRGVNVSRLQDLIAAGKLEASQDVTPATLVELGVVGKNDLVKILGGGELEAGINVSAHKFSASAKAKIEKAGGSATEIA